MGIEFVPRIDVGNVITIVAAIVAIVGSHFHLVNRQSIMHEQNKLNTKNITDDISEIKSSLNRQTDIMLTMARYEEKFKHIEARLNERNHAPPH